MGAVAPDRQRITPGVHGVELLGVIGGRLEQAVVVGLDNAAAETVGQVAAVGDLDQIAVAVHEVVVAAAPQGIVERPEHGPAKSQSPAVVFHSVMPRRMSRPGANSAIILRQRSTSGFHRPQVVAAVVVRADVVENAPAFCSSPGDGKAARSLMPGSTAFIALQNSARPFWYVSSPNSLPICQ